jgi:hypothetical protein
MRHGKPAVDTSFRWPLRLCANCWGYGSVESDTLEWLLMFERRIMVYFPKTNLEAIFNRELSWTWWNFQFHKRREIPNHESGHQLVLKLIIYWHIFRGVWHMNGVLTISRHLPSHNLKQLPADHVTYVWSRIYNYRKKDYLHRIFRDNQPWCEVIHY